MGYWDPTEVTLKVNRNREIWRTEIEGDADGDFLFRAYIKETITLADGTISVIDRGSVECRASEAPVGSPMETRVNQIRNGVRGLARLLRL